MNKQWQSNAEWDNECCLRNPEGKRITTDTHSNKEAAQGVCDLLMEIGWGGDRKIFPIATWVSEKEE